MFNTPILFLVFNRLDTTKQVFAKIREIQPKQLFIGADGARPDKEGEKEKVEAVRNYILENIDWECEVKTLFREKNLGCGKAVSEAITWFFDNVEQGIILEDDTLPDLSFFTFCEQLLNYYKDEERVMHIGGSNFLMNKLKINENYYFSKYPQIWGWATWKNRWYKYNFKIHEEKIEDFNLCLGNYNFAKDEILYWNNVFFNLKNIDTWDYQWIFSNWLYSGISIAPSINLIQNLGFGQDATHTYQKEAERLGIPSQSITKTIFLNNDKILINEKADKITFKQYYYQETTILQKIRNRLSKIKNKIFK
jgi:hypothetical protein